MNGRMEERATAGQMALAQGGRSGYVHLVPVPYAAVVDVAQRALGDHPSQRLDSGVKAVLQRHAQQAVALRS